MNDKEYKFQQRRVSGYVKKWIPRLRLTGWDIGIMYERGAYEVNGQLSDEVLGSCDTKWQYKRIHLTFNLDKMAQHSDHDAEECIVHELVHGMLNEMREWECPEHAIWHEERVVTEVAWAFMEAVNGKQR